MNFSKDVQQAVEDVLAGLSEMDGGSAIDLITGGKFSEVEHMIRATPAPGEAMEGGEVKQ